MSTPKSKFVLFVDDKATPSNRQPNLAGDFALAAGEAPSRLKLWADNLDENGEFTYAHGRVEPQGIGEALKMTIAAPSDVPAPPKVNLDIGEVKLWRDNNATAGNGRPTVFGYARLPNQYVKLGGWKKKARNGREYIAGTAEPYRPYGGSQETPEGGAPKQG